MSGSPLILNANWLTSVVNVPPACSEVSSADLVLAFERCEAAMISCAAA